MLILDSRFWGGGETHIWGVNSIHFLMFFVFWVFFWGGIWDSGGGGEFPPQEIAGNNTVGVMSTSTICIVYTFIMIFHTEWSTGHFLRPDSNRPDPAKH